ncbi:MAG: PD-(D/E)XK nuclease-like domain-containing protein [Planctomycetaceae bacterium]|jgi:hypothetical protein|nr:PD-(D/E)XK nuclease-like domain-containing protein [Planctomycetaceae bacterium]
MTDLDEFLKQTLIDEPFDEYLRKSKEYLTSHQLIDFVKCPYLYYINTTKESEPEKTNTAFLTGSAAHKLILEGEEAFNKCYIAGDPINSKTGNPYGRETQAYGRWIEEQKIEKGNPDLQFLSTEQWYQVQQMWFSVQKHSQAMALLQNGLSERTLRVELEGISCQSRFDWAGMEGTIVDLKTCYSLDTFEEDAQKYRYGIQFVFYQMMYMKAYQLFCQEIHIPQFYIVAVEKSSPYRTGVFCVPTNCFHYFGNIIIDSLDFLKDCRRTGVYPTNFESVKTIKLY